MKHYFMDLEFLCDEDHVYKEDIIAICVLSEDDSFELVRYVRPDFEDFEVSEYCTELTGISKNELQDQDYFADVYDLLLESIEEEAVIYVWGDVDLEAIYQASLDIAGTLEFEIVDFQEEFVKTCGLNFRPGLKKVYVALTGDETVKHHDVKSDTQMLKEIYKQFQADKKATMRKIKK